MFISLSDLGDVCLISAGDTLRNVSLLAIAAIFLLNKDGSCPTADLSNIGRPSGPAYSTGELLNMPLVSGLEHSPKNQRLGLSYICLCTMAGTFVYRFHENSLPS